MLKDNIELSYVSKKIFTMNFKSGKYGNIHFMQMKPIGGIDRMYNQGLK